MKCMMVYSTKWKDADTFKMYPANEECPFLEVIFDPESKVLVVISKENKPSFQMLPKLTNTGDLVKVKGNTQEERYAQERMLIPTYYEYYIESMKDIMTFIDMFAINSLHPALGAVTATDVAKPSPIIQNA